MVLMSSGPHGYMYDLPVCDGLFAIRLRCFHAKQSVRHRKLLWTLTVVNKVNHMTVGKQIRVLSVRRSRLVVPTPNTTSIKMPHCLGGRDRVQGRALYEHLS